MMLNGKPVKKVAIYARCSTDENKQDVQVQLAELRRHCEVMGWSYEEFYEYESAYKGEQPRLQELLKRIKRHEFDCVLTYSLDRWSRRSPSYTNRLLDELVEEQGVRFISKLEGIDSANELTWNVVRPLFTYFANVYSRNLSEKIRLGIRTKKESGTYRGGRPPKKVDVDRLRKLRQKYPDYGYRRLCEVYNEGLPTKEQVSFPLLRRVLKKVSFGRQERIAIN